MTSTIKIQIKNVYGNETIYPACDHARFLAAMAGTKTLTPEKLRLIEAAGYKIEIVVPAALAAGWNGESARRRVGGTFGS
jgi:hypothetical protein